MEQNIIKFCLEKGILLDKETLNLFAGFDEDTAKEVIKKISSLKEKLITKSFITKNAEKISELIGDDRVIEKLKINFGLSLEISRERVVGKTKEELREKLRKIEAGKEEQKEAVKLGNLKVIYSLVNLTKKLEPQDFVRHFRSRYGEMKKFLQDRKELENLSSINKINRQRQSVSVVGIVSDKRTTKNKNILLELEDLTGRVRVIINKNKEEVYDKAKSILVDDVLGVRGFGTKEIIFVNEVVYPEAILQEKAKIDRDESVAFISDLHVGSTNFLEKNFLKFIKWLDGKIGNEKQRERALKVKYLFITGDSVDGVGVFPGQEDLLEIKDIREQYNRLAFYLNKVRKDVKIIICPGQHDAVRVAEPQPFIGREYGSALYELENVVLVSNPAVIEVTNGIKGRGLKILMYHGASMNSYINEIESLRLGKAHDNPAKVVKELLKRRHLASMHSFVTYIPSDKQDPLLIREVPDIINTADLHKTDIDTYNNILIICSGCWQSMTPFEEKVGNKPDPCKVPILNLKTREIKILDFSDEK
jgi:DNA polymerase II small subunit